MNEPNTAAIEAANRQSSIANAEAAWKLWTDFHQPTLRDTFIRIYNDAYENGLEAAKAAESADTTRDALVREALGIDIEGDRLKCGDCEQWTPRLQIVAYDVEETVRCPRCAALVKAREALKHYADADTWRCGVLIQDTDGTLIARTTLEAIEAAIAEEGKENGDIYKGD